MQSAYIKHEKERLLNLVEAYVKRNELDIAITHAQDLYSRMTAHELREKAVRLAGYLRITNQITGFLVAITLVTMTLTIMDILPNINLLISYSTATATGAAICLTTHLLRQFAFNVEAARRNHHQGSRHFAAQFIKDM
jgi:hypothetical protein